MTTVSVETENIAQLIKDRRMELGLSVEDAARKADVGVKTWYRYESGSPIRMDKVKRVCKALNWSRLPGQEEIDISEYKNSEAWSEFVETNFGTIAAIAFTVGSDILLDYIQQDLEELSKRPQGTHIGELQFSCLEDFLPRQFLMHYDYSFLYKMRCEFILLRKYLAHVKKNFRAHTVMQELLIYLSDDIGRVSFDMDENVEKLLEHDEACMDDYFSNEEYEYGEDDDQLPLYNTGWVFDLFDDADIVTYLYSDVFLDSDCSYHFDHWYEEQFYVEKKE